jgi:hypothetical protein
MGDLHNRWPHRWLNPKAEVRSSNIHGTGVFAKKKILKGESVGVLGGVIVHKNDIREYRSLMAQVGIQIDDNFFIVPTTREELEKCGVFNHSCEPNIGFSNSITLVAMRDIGLEEELVFDYAFSETFDDDIICHCGAIKCRKKITANDRTNADIQKKILPLFFSIHQK